jgi:hypothetical protein
VDSKNMGNKLRFSNHSKKDANAYARVLFINGYHRVCLFATKNINKYDEILFDYDGNKILCEKFSWINDDKPQKLPLPKQTTTKLTHNKRHRVEAKNVDCKMIDFTRSMNSTLGDFRNDETINSEISPNKKFKSNRSNFTKKNSLGKHLDFFIDLTDLKAFD